MKKRYMVSLDESKAEELKGLLREIGLPRGSFSAMINDALPGMTRLYRSILEKQQNGEQMSLGDVVAEAFRIGADNKEE